jgi:hypothetical protein
LAQPAGGITRRGFLGVRLGQDITPTNVFRNCIFDESYTDPAAPFHRQSMPSALLPDCLLKLTC